MTARAEATPRLDPGCPFFCEALRCSLAVVHCVERQEHSQAERRTQGLALGQGGTFRSCVTERCAQGRAIRDALDPERLRPLPSAWALQRPGGTRSPAARRAQLEARLRAEAVGLGAEVPTMDAEPPGEP